MNGKNLDSDEESLPTDSVSPEPVGSRENSDSELDIEEEFNEHELDDKELDDEVSLESLSAAYANVLKQNDAVAS